MRGALWNTQMLAGKVGEEKGVGKPLSQELEVQVLVLILCGAIYGSESLP